MIIFRQTQGPEGGVISGGKGPVIPSPSQNKEAGRIKVLTALNKVREEVKAFREAMRAFT